MWPTLRRASKALVPLAVCVLLPLPVLESNLRTTRPPPTPKPRDQRYFANDSLLGVKVNCSAAEKECLRYNRLWVPASNNCYPLGDGPEGCRLAVDRCELERESGHLRGKCVPGPVDSGCPRSGERVRMAFDGRCYLVRDLATVCGDGPHNLAMHFFGDSECVESAAFTSPPPPVYIPQPEKEGECVIPNLRHDMSSVKHAQARVLVKECSEKQSGCFARGQVWCEHIKGCCNLLRNDACEEGKRVVLNRTAWEEEGSVRATCAPVFPCGNASRLMAFDGRCYDAATVLRVLCPGGVLLPDAFGEMACITRHYYRHVVELRSSRPMICQLSHRVALEIPPRGQVLEPECGITETGRCVDAFLPRTVSSLPKMKNTSFHTSTGG